MCLRLGPPKSAPKNSCERDFIRKSFQEKTAGQQESGPGTGKGQSKCEVLSTVEWKGYGLALQDCSGVIPQTSPIRS